MDDLSLMEKNIENRFIHLGFRDVLKIQYKN